MTSPVGLAGSPERSRVAGLCAMAVRSVPVGGAAVVLASDAGHRVLLASSDVVSDRLEELCGVYREGPAIDAVVEARPVLAGDLSGEVCGGRWPIFVPEARRLGVQALFALPMQIGVINLGTFVMYRRTPG